MGPGATIAEAFKALRAESPEFLELLSKYDQQHGQPPRFDIRSDLERPVAWDPDSKAIVFKAGSDQFDDRSKLQRRLVMELANAVLDARYEKLWDQAKSGEIDQATFTREMERVEYDAVKMHHQIFGDSPNDPRDIFGDKLSSDWQTFEGFQADQNRERGTQGEKRSHTSFYGDMYQRAQTPDAERGYVYHATVPKDHARAKPPGSSTRSAARSPERRSPAGGPPSRSPAAKADGGQPGRGRVTAGGDGAASLLFSQGELRERSEAEAKTDATLRRSVDVGPATFTGEVGGSASGEAGYTATGDRHSAGAQVRAEGRTRGEVAAGPARLGVFGETEAVVGGHGGVDHHFDGKDITVGADVDVAAKVRASAGTDVALGDAHAKVQGGVGAGAEVEGDVAYIQRNGVPGVSIQAGFDAGAAVGGEATVGTKEASATLDAGALAGVALGAGARFGMQEDGKFHIELNGKIAAGIGVQFGIDLAFDLEAIEKRLKDLDPRKWAPELANLVGDTLKKAGAFSKEALDKFEEAVIKPLTEGFEGIKDTFKDVFSEAFDWVEDRFEDVAEFAEDVVDEAKDVVEDVKDFGEDVVEGAKDFGEDVAEGFKNVGEGIGKAFGF